MEDDYLPRDFLYHQLESKIIIPKPIMMDLHIPKIPKEEDKGNREYKWKLKYNEMDKTDLRDKREKKKKEKTASQLLYRILEGKGKAVYIIGVHDDGNNVGISLTETYESIRFFVDCAKIIQAKIQSIKIYRGKEGYITTIRVHLNIDLHYSVFIM
jgi:GTPase